MSRSVDWYYYRTGCTACWRVSGFLDTCGAMVAERVPASRRLGRAEAESLVRGAREVYITRGRRLKRFAGGTPTRDIVAEMLGRTGNLRAPTLRIGDIVVVGYDRNTLKDVIG